MHMDKMATLADDCQMRLKTQLDKIDHISVTIDIWSDRKIRKFLDFIYYM